MNSPEDRTPHTAAMQPAPQFQTVSPIALRHYIAELNRSNSDLRERLRHQERITRNTVAVGVLSALIVAASMSFTFCLQEAPTRPTVPLLAQHAATPPPTVPVTLR